MAKYFKLLTYTGGEDYETRETLINFDTFRKFQQEISEGKDLLILSDRIIKVSSIKEISPADDIVEYHLKTGTSLKSLGLAEPTQADRLKNDPELKKLN